MKTNSWSNIASTLSKRDSLGLTMLEGEVFAVGGYNDLDCKYLKTVEKYDPKSNSWTKVKSMHMARRSPGLINYRGKLYVIGGMGEVEDLNSVEVFDPTTGVWTKFKHPLSEICGESVGDDYYVVTFERKRRLMSTCTCQTFLTAFLDEIYPFFERN